MSPASRSRATAPAAFELKSAALTLVSVVLHTADVEALADALEARFSETPDLFDADPVVIDVSALSTGAAPDAEEDAAPASIDFARIVELLRARRMAPVAVKGATQEQLEAAREAGLSEAPLGVQPMPRAQPVRADEPPVTPPAEAAPPTAAAANAPSAAPTVVIDRPLRSGQQVYARNADLIVMAAVSFGAEVIADGHIHIYGPLRGRAIAGASGNTAARIFATCMEPQLVSIAGTYRTVEKELPADVQGRPAQVRLDGERLVIEALKN